MGNPFATAVAAVSRDQAMQGTMVAVLRLMTSTARPARRLKVLNSSVKLKEASSPAPASAAQLFARRAGCHEPDGVSKQTRST